MAECDSDADSSMQRGASPPRRHFAASAPCSLTGGKVLHSCGLCLYADVTVEDKDLYHHEMVGLITRLRQIAAQNSGTMPLRAVAQLCADFASQSENADMAEFSAEKLLEHFQVVQQENIQMAFDERLAGLNRLITSLEKTLGRKRPLAEAEGADEVHVHDKTAALYLKCCDGWLKMCKGRPRLV